MEKQGYPGTLKSTPVPLVVAYGLGVDSTAALVAMARRGITPDAILFADVGDEKRKTYAYLSIIRAWLKAVGFPDITVVRYVPKSFPAGTEYWTLGGFCLANGTLPSLAFGIKACSIKWKVRPQQQWIEQWDRAREIWSLGGKVRVMIGYDASTKDMRRYAQSVRISDERYEYWYPLIGWGYDRDECKRIIIEAGLPLPPKSACRFCPATKPEELLEFTKEDLRYIVVMEANAAPRLQGLMDEQQLMEDFHSRHARWKAKLSRPGADIEKLMRREPRLGKVGKGCAGLWRTSTRTRPAAMTDFIAKMQLLPEEEICYLRANAAALAKELIDPPPGDITDFRQIFPEDDAGGASTPCTNCRLAE